MSKLEQQLSLPRRGLFADIADRKVIKALDAHIICDGSVSEDRSAILESLRAKTDATKKRGRPSFGEPWKAEGISRREWFRRKAKGEL